MYKGVVVRFPDFISFFRYPMKMKLFGLFETKLFHFRRIFMGREEGSNDPTKPPLDMPPLGGGTDMNSAFPIPSHLYAVIRGVFNV